MPNTRQKKNLEPLRSVCPIACTLEVLGDKWSLLIIRDLLYSKKSTYNEFLNSPEKISTNILQDKLNKLFELGLITFTGTAKRKKYELTQRGRDVKPVLDAMGKFGNMHFSRSKNMAELIKSASDRLAKKVEL